MSMPMKVDKGVSTWRIWSFYIQYLKELTFAKSKSTGNKLASSFPTRTITGHINNQYKVLVNILYLIFNI